LRLSQSVAILRPRAVPAGEKQRAGDGHRRDDLQGEAQHTRAETGGERIQAEGQAEQSRFAGIQAPGTVQVGPGGVVEDLDQDAERAQAEGGQRPAGCFAGPDAEVLAPSPVYLPEAHAEECGPAQSGCQGRVSGSDQGGACQHGTGHQGAGGGGQEQVGGCRKGKPAHSVRDSRPEAVQAQSNGEQDGECGCTGHCGPGWWSPSPLWCAPGAGGVPLGPASSPGQELSLGVFVASRVRLCALSAHEPAPVGATVLWLPETDSAEKAWLKEDGTALSEN